MNKKLLITGILMGILFPASSFAIGIDLINVRMNPKVPGENQEVTVSLDSFSTDLNSSEIIWYEDGVAIKQGIGEKSVMVSTGEFGKTINLTAVILGNLGTRVEKKVVITPAEIDVLWEAQTYTPPFYKGKALPTYKSLVKVTAIPRYGKADSDPKSFMYNWKYNRTLGVGQGLGKSTVLIKMGYADTAVPVSVEVSLPGGSWSGQRMDNISGGEAVLRFYEQAPLLGINFNKQVSAKTLGSGNQFTIKAVPYFFSTEDIASDVLIYTWRVNNREAIPGLDPTILTVSKIGSDEEQLKEQEFTASLKVQTPKHVLQQGVNQATITLPPETN